MQFRVICNLRLTFSFFPTDSLFKFSSAISSSTGMVECALQIHPIITTPSKTQGFTYSRIATLIWQSSLFFRFLTLNNMEVVKSHFSFTYLFFNCHFSLANCQLCVKGNYLAPAAPHTNMSSKPSTPAHSTMLKRHWQCLPY